MASIVLTSNTASTDEDDALQRDEIEALTAIFAENFELVRDTPPRRIRISVAGEVILTVSLPTSYPSTAQPQCTLSVHPRSACKRSTKDFIQHYKFPPFEKGGLGCIYDHIQDVSDRLPKLEEVKSMSGHGDEEERLLLFIDHMNDSVSYQKLLKRWSEKLDLQLEIWYRVVSKSKHCKRNSSARAEVPLRTGKKTRAENIYIFLQGAKPDIDVFLQKLKVEYVDINKQGIKCKERKSKILMRMLMQTHEKAACRFSFANFAQQNPYSKETQLNLRQRLANFGYTCLDTDTSVKSKEPDSHKRIILIKFDHIKSKQVRKGIKGIATSLSLRGLYRPGKPGLVCVEGTSKNVAEFEKKVRLEFSSCTRNSGCWGPANHHFQSIRVIGEKYQCDRDYFESQFVEVETESLMHVAHKFVNAGLKQLFFSSFPTLNPNWDIPSTTGNPDPYLKQRGGTRRKCSNKRIL